MIHHRPAHPLASGGLTRVHRLHFGVRGIEPLERSDSYEHAASVGAKERDGRVQKAVDSQGMHVARRRYPSENVRCTSSRARTSSTRGSSTAMTRAMLRSLPRGRAPRRHRVAYARSTVDEHRSIGTCSPARTDMQPDEPIEHELLRNAVAAEVTVTSTEA